MIDGKSKPGPKLGSTIKSRVAKRMQKFNGFPAIQLKEAKEFNTKAQELVNNQMAKYHQKSLTSYLDLNETRIVVELLKMNNILAGKLEEEQELSEEMLNTAISIMKEKKDKNG